MGCDNYDFLKMDSTHILSIQNLISGGVYNHTHTHTHIYGNHLNNDNVGCDNYDSLKIDSTHELSIQKSNLWVSLSLYIYNTHTTAAAQALNFITTARKFSIMLILLTIYDYLYYSHTTVSVESSGYRILDEELELL